MKSWLLTGLFSLVPQLVLAAAGEEDLLYPALKMLGGLGIVLGLLLVFYAFGRKGLSLMPRQRGGQIQVLETRSLGGKKMLCLVRVRQQELLLGVSSERIECLTQLAATESNFSETLERATGAGNLPRSGSLP